MKQFFYEVILGFFINDRLPKPAKYTIIAVALILIIDLITK